MKRNDLRRADTGFTQRSPDLAPLAAQPTLAPPLHPPPASRPQPRPPLGGERGGPNGPKWTQSAPKCTFFTFGAQNAKKCSFSTFGAESPKKCSFSHFGSQKSKFRCRNHLFHKHLRPGGKKDPKMHFWAQKRILEPEMHFGHKNAFWAPKCSPAQRVQSGTPNPAPL